ncbi:potassium uptake protein, TrkH family [Streptococcus viridans]|uniref:Potassium uptake protein, TrkH family n=1 Tax=Streptococcus viridans TaxID=78535 RepID=A0ABD7NCN8_9STRE|nr:potassium uptake protein, TrkH family [Streptococcus viridans]
MLPFGHHTFSPSTIQKAFSVLIVFTTTFIIGLTFLTMVADNGHRFIYLMFEAMSALGTVGVTANLTPTLNHAALTVIMFLMFIGRIGPLTLIVSLSNRKPKKKDTIKFANANIIIG